MNITRLDLSLAQYEVGLSGAIPNRADWSEPAMDRGILEFVSLFSGIVIKYGGRIVHGCHPTFTPVILRQARQQRGPGPRKPVTLVMSELWARDLSANDIESMTDVAEFVITTKIGDKGQDDADMLTPSMGFLGDAVDDLRGVDAGGFEDCRHDIDEVMELRASAADVDMPGPRHDHALPGSADEKLREDIFANQKRLGVIPADSELTPWPDGQPEFGGAKLPRWDSLTMLQKKLYARQAEVFAAYVAYTDYEIGRVIQQIEDMGKLDNTLIIYICGDNGNSAEGTEEGTLNAATEALT